MPRPSEDLIHRTIGAPDRRSGHPGTENEEAPYWAVCRTFSNRVPWVRPLIEKTEHGTFMPTYVRVWSSDGKLSMRERALMPGYLFFMTRGDMWGEVKNVEGVYDVLSNDGIASKVSDEEMRRLVIGHILGDANDINLEGLDYQRGGRNPARDRGRRPRRSKRARSGNV